MAFTFTGHVKTLELQGTDAQIRWAKTIRSQRASALDKLGPSGIGKLIHPVIGKHSEELTKVGFDTPERMGAFISAAGAFILSEPQASIWIQNKHLKIPEMITEAAEKVAVEFIAHPPDWTAR